MLKELLGTAGALETGRLRVSSLPGTRPVPKEEGLSTEVCLLLPSSLPERAQVKVPMRPRPASVSLFLLLRDAKESGGEQPQPTGLSPLGLVCGSFGATDLAVIVPAPLSQTLG